MDSHIREIYQLIILKYCGPVFKPSKNTLVKKVNISLNCDDLFLFRTVIVLFSSAISSKSVSVQKRLLLNMKIEIAQMALGELYI